MTIEKKEIENNPEIENLLKNGHMEIKDVEASLAKLDELFKGEKTPAMIKVMVEAKLAQQEYKIALQEFKALEAQV